MRIIELDEQGMLSHLAAFLSNPGADGLRLERIATKTGVPHAVLLQIIAGAFEGEIPPPLLAYAGMRPVTRYEWLHHPTQFDTNFPQFPCRGDD